jgi:hypothetical protein
MAPKYCNNTAAAVKHMNAAGLVNVHFLDLTASSTNVDPAYMGCGNHPSAAGHAKVATGGNVIHAPPPPIFVLYGESLMNYTWGHESDLAVYCYAKAAEIAIPAVAAALGW